MMPESSPNGRKPGNGVFLKAKAGFSTKIHETNAAATVNRAIGKKARLLA